MAITGDFSALKQFRDELARAPQMIGRAAVMASDEIAPLVAAQISKGTDAYEQPWVFTKPMMGSGGWFGVGPNAVKVTATAHSIRATVSTRSGRYFDRGRRFVSGRRGGAQPARPLIPRGDSIPEAWIVALDSAVAKALGPSFMWLEHTQAKQAAQAKAAAAQTAKREQQAQRREARALDKFKRDIARVSRKGRS